MGQLVVQAPLNLLVLQIRGRNHQQVSVQQLVPLVRRCGPVVLVGELHDGLRGGHVGASPVAPVIARIIIARLDVVGRIARAAAGEVTERAARLVPWPPVGCLMEDLPGGRRVDPIDRRCRGSTRPTRPWCRRCCGTLGSVSRELVGAVRREFERDRVLGPFDSAAVRCSGVRPGPGHLGRRSRGPTGFRPDVARPPGRPGVPLFAVRRPTTTGTRSRSRTGSRPTATRCGGPVRRLLSLALPRLGAYQPRLAWPMTRWSAPARSSCR